MTAGLLDIATARPEASAADTSPVHDRHLVQRCRTVTSCPVRQRLRPIGLVVLAAAVLSSCQAPVRRSPPDVLTPDMLHTPHYTQHAAQPTVAVLRQLFRDLGGPAGLSLRRRAAPNQAGMLWIMVLVGLFVAADPTRGLTGRNLDLLLLTAPALCFFEILAFFQHLDDPTYLRLLDWVFVAIATLSVCLLVRAAMLVYRPRREWWNPPADTTTLAVVALLLLALNVYVALVRPPDDAGFYVNLGAQRLRERGLLPYGDPLLTGTPGAAYGPVLYALHVPFQILLAPAGVNAAPADLPLAPGQAPYFLPPALATQLCVVVLHVAGVAALFAAARRMRNVRVAWALVALYCGSAYVLGVGSEGDLIGGMTFVSHIAPASTVLLAFALIHRPAWSGAVLAAAIGMLFYPVFLVPAWAGYYWARRAQLRKFAMGFTLTAALIGGGVLALSRPAAGRGVIATVLHDTLGHQEDPEGYASSPFGLWAGRGGLRGWLMQPVIPSTPTSRPIVLLYLLFSGAAFVMARGRREGDLALLVGALSIGAQLWKIHATGTYVAWYYPFLLLGFFACPPARQAGRNETAGAHPMSLPTSPAPVAVAGREPSRPAVLVVGAGPAGLTAAYELVRRGAAVTVLEQDAQVGGIARTVEYKGFRFDIGGHRFFTKVPYVQDLWHRMLGPDMLKRPRLSRIYYRGRFFHYPLRPMNALLGLGPWNALVVAASYVRSRLRPIRPEVSFEDWVTNRFGRRLYLIFFKTYTEKVWGIPCDTIGAQWAAQRIKGLSLWTAIRSMLFGGSAGTKTLIDSFEYPRLGPGMMWERFRGAIEAEGGRVELETALRSIAHDRGRVTSVVTVRRGVSQRHPVDRLLSTMPLRVLIESLEPPPPPRVLEAARRLKYRDFLTVAVIIDVPDLFPDNWIYVHDPQVRMGRVQNFKNWSPDMVPDPAKTCLGLEYFCFEGDDLWTMKDDALVELGRRELAAIRLVDPDKVIDGCVVRMPKAYPVYDEGYEAALAIVREYLGGFSNLQVAGRNGMHKYNNQDHSMVTAMLAARNLLGERHDVWSVNADDDYHEESRDGEEGELARIRAALSDTQPIVPR